MCAEGPDGDIYCKLCYAYKHGHKAKPNPQVADVAAIPGDSGEMDVCPRLVIALTKLKASVFNFVHGISSEQNPPYCLISG